MHQHNLCLAHIASASVLTGGGGLRPANKVHPCIAHTTHITTTVDCMRQQQCALCTGSSKGASNHYAVGKRAAALRHAMARVFVCVACVSVGRRKRAAQVVSIHT